MDGTSQLFKGTETILLAEDNEPLRRLSARILEAAGYRVLAAPSGAQALRLLDEHGPVDMLLTDVMMPGMNGGELAARVESARQCTCVLFTSGSPDEAIRESVALDETSAPFLSKPYAPDELLAKVRQVLDRTRPGV